MQQITLIKLSHSLRILRHEKCASRNFKAAIFHRILQQHSSYLTVNTLCLHMGDQPVSVF